jgi:hypothetical protein
MEQAIPAEGIEAGEGVDAAAPRADLRVDVPECGVDVDLFQTISGTTARCL